MKKPVPKREGLQVIKKFFDVIEPCFHSCKVGEMIAVRETSVAIDRDRVCHIMTLLDLFRHVYRATES
jgi:hypothetical protein